MLVHCPRCNKPVEIAPENFGIPLTCPHCQAVNQYSPEEPPLPQNPQVPPGIKEALAYLSSIDTRLGTLEAEARTRRSNSGGRTIVAIGLIVFGLGGLGIGALAALAGSPTTLAPMAGVAVFLLSALVVAKAFELMAAD